MRLLKSGRCAPLVLLILVTLQGPQVKAGAVSAPDDSESTIIPPSLVYGERPPTEAEVTRADTSGHRKSSSPSRGPSNSDVVVETQHATCYIVSEDLDLEATAKATITTTVLKELCNASEQKKLSERVDEKLQNLDFLIKNQVTELKALILNVEERMQSLDSLIRRGTGLPPPEKDETTRFCPCGSIPPNSPHNPPGSELVRHDEIHNYNSSIHFVSVPVDLQHHLFDGGNTTSINPARTTMRVFTYYWRVKDMLTKLTRWDQRRSVRSPSFYIYRDGYKMYLRLFPRQSGGKNVYFHVGITKGEFDDSLEWPFKLKHKLSILNQREDGSQHDIQSRVWDPTVLCSEYNWKRPTTNVDNYECVGLGLPQDTLRNRDYILNNTIVVKLTVFLDL